ncbi:hypothetical protein K431DRAFT_218424 [Polychaeton citri CBS 116435]|uniref:Glutamyl-tRNA amidotransferase complex subunit Gta3 domain-containing protein n=1 Tax=Polychaeton citri CBS 116435 TaxID=1314669 RepID=A0A9P4USQ9_9PEZI|nr:hypothetical protein K431DRAFT_218424 [Polychaeton citri CBS 116435]
MTSSLNLQRTLSHRSQQLRSFTTSGPGSEASKALEAPANGKVDIDTLLEKPSWSVSALMQPPTALVNLAPITSKQLHHLLRLSALPPPISLGEEHKMLSTLESQLHFVREIQKVDTTGVQPLTSLRDETTAGEKEAEIGLDALAEAVRAEEVRGKFHPRIRRKKGTVAISESQSVDQWDVLSCTERKAGRYFVVEGGKS